MSAGPGLAQLGILPTGILSVFWLPVFFPPAYRYATPGAWASAWDEAARALIAACRVRDRSAVSMA